MTAPALSIVTPVYNEAGILPELVTRCTHAAERHGLPFELVIVDDASTDETPALLAALAHDDRVRPCRLSANRGQFRATQAGLRQAAGNWVVVLDGDLQDPPEEIPRLVDALARSAPSVLAVLAVKSQRDDPIAFMVGQFVFHRVQHWLSRVALPLGAGSYCVMRRAVAQRVALADFGRANLGAVLAVTVLALGGELATVSYEKGPRYDGSGRVGWQGLVAEALESLAVTGALSRLLALVAIGLAIGGLAGGSLANGRLILFGAAATSAVAAAVIGLRVRRTLVRVRAEKDGSSIESVHPE
jgi:dolichol-phosphate mannosyltransferase